MKSEAFKKACELMSKLSDEFIDKEDSRDEETIKEGEKIRDELDILWYKQLTKEEKEMFTNGTWRKT